jgi:hypothetical protein
MIKGYVIGDTRIDYRSLEPLLACGLLTRETPQAALQARRLRSDRLWVDATATVLPASRCGEEAVKTLKRIGLTDTLSSLL